MIQRVNELKTAAENSAANHNSLIGRLHEAEHVLAMMDACGLDDQVEVIEASAVE